MPTWFETSQIGQPLSDLIDLPETDALYKTAPPPFGHPMLKCFGFDPEYINLNHAAYGSLSNPVREAATALSVLIERNPDKFTRLTYQRPLVRVRERLAAFIGAETDEVVLVPNASHGIATVLRNFEWQTGDILVGATTSYNSVLKTLQLISDTAPHPALAHFDLKLPTTHAQIVASFREHIRSLPRRAANENPNSPQKIVAVIDSVASVPGVLLPWREMVKVCREEGVWTVIDGAQSMGQEGGLDVGASGCDFWTSNSHKWLIGKRSSAVLYVAKRNQHMIKSPIPTPATYAPRTDPGFPGMVAMFEWNGTVDFIPNLTVDVALDFRLWLGGEEKINGYCHALALAGGKAMVAILGTEVMHGKDEDELTLNMVNVALPIPAHIPYTPAIDTTFRERLLGPGGANTYVAHYPHNGRVWVRCSAQIWNEVADFEYAARALKGICEEIVQAHGDKVQL